jgi:3-phosphoshikimate 1-carboxyvinyltransferase
MSLESLILSKKTREFSGMIQLTGSKSESNRALILEALSDGKVEVNNLSSAADTVTLDRILSSDLGLQASALIDVGPAGTAMRFLTAYYATKTQRDVTLTGTERMKQRPIGILADALISLGAKIEYEEKDGFPPIILRAGFAQKSKRIKIKGDISSQYITALLLIAATLPLGLELEIEGDLTSRPYVEMTLALLDQTGIKHTWKDNLIEIAAQPFQVGNINVEPDWSAASYWYAIAALCTNAEIRLPYLRKYSLQGDSRIAEIMANFGITSVFDENGLTITKEDKVLSRKIFDFKECPDLAQTVIVCCAALGHDATFTGLETLKIKETDRVLALQNELGKMGVKLIEKNMVYKLDCSERFTPEKIYINTYEDHRMAMAFAPLALIINEVEVEDPSVVNKSYPHFWDDLSKAGFGINVLRNA